MKQRILDLIMDMIISKTDNYQEDCELEAAIADFIEYKELVKRWETAGLKEEYLGIWITPYLAPVKSLNFEQTVNYFKDYALLMRINEERLFFLSLDDKVKIPRDALRKRYNDFCDIIAPLISSGRYNDYTRTLISLIQTSIADYLK